MSVALEDLKEPELNRKTKGRPQGTKRLPTKQELIECAGASRKEEAAEEN